MASERRRGLAGHLGCLDSAGPLLVQPRDPRGTVNTWLQVVPCDSATPAVRVLRRRIESADHGSSKESER